MHWPRLLLGVHVLHARPLRHLVREGHCLPRRRSGSGANSPGCEPQLIPPALPPVSGDGAEIIHVCSSITGMDWTVSEGGHRRPGAGPLPNPARDSRPSSPFPETPREPYWCSAAISNGKNGSWLVSAVQIPSYPASASLACRGTSARSVPSPPSTFVRETLLQSGRRRGDRRLLLYIGHGAFGRFVRSLNRSRRTALSIYTTEISVELTLYL